MRKTKVPSCCKEEVLARHNKERVKQKTENKGKTLECNHLEMRDTIMSFLMHQYAN